MGLDLEFANLNGRQDEFAPPYLLYQGKLNLRWGGEGGYALMLEQTRIVWDLSFYH